MEVFSFTIVASHVISASYEGERISYQFIALHKENPNCSPRVMPATLKRPASLSPKQIAEACGVTRRTVYSWIESGELRTIRVSNRHRITEKQLAEKVGSELAEATFDAYSNDEA